MLTHELTEDECGAALDQVSFGRLACARGDQPYIVPIYFSYDRKHLYGVTTLGQKIEWMRSNPLVCLEIDERTSHYHWMSVVVFGRYEEIPDTPKYEYARKHALEVLQKRAMWWQPACVATEKREQRPPIFYRIHIKLVERHPIDAIQQTARETGSAMVVMGAVSRSGLKRVFIDNTAERVLNQLTCDALVVKPARSVSRVARARRGVWVVAGGPPMLPYSRHQPRIRRADRLTA